MANPGMEGMEELALAFGSDREKTSYVGTGERLRGKFKEERLPCYAYL